MTISEEIIIIAACVAGTMATRFLPFIIFRPGRPTPKYIGYLGRTLPAAVFGMLVIYSLKDISFSAPAFWLPALISLACVVALHIKWRRMLLSIAGGTLVYMLLLRFLFAG